MAEEAEKKKKEDALARRIFLEEQIVRDFVGQPRKTEAKGLTRTFGYETNQTHYAQGIIRAQEAVEWRKKEVLQDVALAHELLADRAKEEQRTNKRRELRENSDLKELEQRLKTAYTQKELHTQLEAKKAEKFKLELEQQEEVYKLKTIGEAIAAFDENRKIESAKKKREYREFLQDQMIEKHKQKVEERKQALEDKLIVADAVKVAEEIEKNNEGDRLIKMKQLNDDIDEFNRCRQLWIRKEKERELEEERKIKEYLEDRFRKEQYLQDMTRRREEAKLKFHEAIVNILKQSQGRLDEEERINQILLDEDNRIKEEMKLKSDHDNKIKRRNDLRQVFANQVEEKLVLLEEKRKSDFQYLQQMITDKENYQKREKELAEQKHLQRVKYATELKQDIEEKERQRQRDLYHRINEYHSLIRDNQARVKEIDNERMLMLQEHASRLLGFLPKGVIRNIDLPHLDPAVQQFYNYTPINDEQNKK